MNALSIKNITSFYVLFFFSAEVIAQPCIKDSNYYSLTYQGQDKNYIKTATIISENEVVTLSKHSEFSHFVTKFTSQGGAIWSNEYIPDYPYVSYVQYPWYNNTLMEGMAAGKDSTCFIFGSATEHGKSINNVEDPPTHQVGLFLHLDKFGKVITGKYFGQWRTSYSVNALLQLPDGNMVVYLRSLAAPFISKLICVNIAGDILWGLPMQTDDRFYREINTTTPVLKQRSNGNILVVNQMTRNIDDTLNYPFLQIIIPAPLYYFHMLEVDTKKGAVQWENSFQAPPLTNTNSPNSFIPIIKNMQELPNGNISFCADMYIPDDNLIFYKHYKYKKSAVNFITDKDGYFLKMLAYHPVNSGSILLSATSTGSNGEQTLLLKDVSNQQLILCKIDGDGQYITEKAFTNLLPTDKSGGIALQKKDGKGYFIFNSDPESVDFYLNVTNAIGDNPCTQTAVSMESENILWPWFVDKIHLLPNTLNIDFHYSPFNFKINQHPITQQTNCEYETACCKDVIDSLHPKNIFLCENETYSLPDNTKVKESGTYYSTFKTTGGCDSITFYNIKVLKSPSHLQASGDTCLMDASSIQLHATEGYEKYWWNNVAADKPFTTVNSTGTFTVRVENRCGTKTDTVRVYDRCEFSIYLPSAFTPNGDFLNDVLKVPDLNKNRFRRLSIYNRTGQLIFSSADQHIGWDGKVGGLAQPVGVYVYLLEMEALSGKILRQHGTITLIR